MKILDAKIYIAFERKKLRILCVPFVEGAHSERSCISVKKKWKEEGWSKREKNEEMEGRKEGRKKGRKENRKSLWIKKRKNYASSKSEANEINWKVEMNKLDME